MIEIRNRWTNAVLYTSDAVTVRAALIAAVAARANLRDANLADANLRGADLRDANLRGADLRDANLRGANLAGADLTGADLRGADLRGANLRDADLTRANLTRANLTDANLTDANLTRANLTDANHLTAARNDLYAVLDAAPAEVPALLAAVREGRIKGTAYEGECACLVGTIANARGCHYEALPGLKPNSERPAERWFLNLMPGHVEGISVYAALTVQWIEAWMREHEAQP